MKWSIQNRTLRVGRFRVSCLRKPFSIRSWLTFLTNLLNQIDTLLDTLLDKIMSILICLESLFLVGNWLLSQASVDMAPYFVITVEPLLMWPLDKILVVLIGWFQVMMLSLSEPCDTKESYMSFSTLNIAYIAWMLIDAFLTTVNKKNSHNNKVAIIYY